MSSSIDDFLTHLTLARFEGAVFNQYAAGQSETLDRANAIRLVNLRLYLELMAEARPVLLLVGEAPGYRGCRLTGVPFTSETIIGEDRIWPFGRRAGFRLTGESPKPVREATATIVWSTLHGLLPPPLLWNAFPFHPHRPDKPMSNRPPSLTELKAGARYVAGLLSLFPVDTVAAIGRSAALALTIAGIQEFCVLRHPSHGGKAKFHAGLHHLIASTLD